MDLRFEAVRSRGLRLLSSSHFYHHTRESVWEFQWGEGEIFEIEAATEFQAWGLAVARCSEEVIGTRAD